MTSSFEAPAPDALVVAIANQKGGVGKSTTAINLGAALALQGERILLVDLDPQGNTSCGLGIDRRALEWSTYDLLVDGVSVEDVIEPTSVRDLLLIPATIELAGAEIEMVSMFSREKRLAGALKQVLDQYDFVLIDCPPSLGLLTINGLAAAAEVMIPIQCEYYALEGVSQLMANIQRVRANVNPELDVEGRDPDDVRRADQPGGRRGGSGEGPLRGSGIPHRHPAHGPSLRGAVLRRAHRGFRSDVARCHRLP